MNQGSPTRSEYRTARFAAHILIVAVPILFFVVWIALYGELNRLGSRPDVAAKFTAPSHQFPWLYQPWLAFAYAAGGLVLPGLPFLFNWGFRGMARVLGTYALGSACCFTIYALYPVVIDRPAYNSGRLGEEVMRSVVALDHPANCFPSAHAFFAVAAASLMGRAARWIRWLTWSLSITVVISTVAVGQHYFMDAAAGAGLGAASWVIVHRFLRPRPEPGRRM